MIQPSEHNKQTVESYFGFQQPPFGVTPDPRFFYMNTAYRDALAEVAHGITAKKGLMLLTGEVGTGKTILLRKLMRDLDTVKFIFVSFSHVISDRFLDVVSSNLGLEKKKTKVDMSQELTKYLLQRATDGQVVALLVDEAQNASDRGFETLCALSNLETDDEKLLQIVLVGQPELIIKLDKPSLRQVKQRVAIQHTVTGLQTKSEIDHYIRHRLNVVGYNGPEIFTQEALDAIWDYSGGTPRLVNILCDNSLALACEAGNRNISGDVAIKAAEKFNLKRIVQLPTFADAQTAVGGMADVGMAAEGNGASIGNGNGLDGSAISPHSSEPAFIGPQQLSLSGELSINATEEAVRLPAAGEQASSGRSQDPSVRHGKFTEVTGSLRGIRQTRSRNRFGIRWKIAGVFSALTLILSAILIGAVYRLSERTLREQLDKRALAVARNLSDASAGYILSNDLLALNTLLRKYTFLEEFAYAFVQDTGGAITAHTLETLPAEFHQTVRSGSERVPWRRELLLQGKPIYETSVPVLDGQIGVVHVGFWGDAVEKEIRRAILPLIAIIAIIPVVGVALSFVLAHWIAGPIIRLRKVAQQIIEGDLEAPGEYTKSRDEIGDLARSLERMRASLGAAMSRLRSELG